MEGRSLRTTHTTIIHKIIYWEIILKAKANPKQKPIYIYIQTNIYIDIYIYISMDRQAKNIREA